MINVSKKTRFALAAIIAPWTVLGIHDLHDVIEVHRQYPMSSVAEMMSGYFLNPIEWTVAYGTFWIFVLPISAFLSNRRLQRGLWEMIIAAPGGFLGTIAYCFLWSAALPPELQSPIDIVRVVLLSCGGALLFVVAAFVFALIAGHPFLRANSPTIVESA
jgi:hypothetical protein